MSKDKANKAKQGAQSKSDFWASVKLLLIIVILILVPLVLRDIQWDEKNLKWISRVVGGACMTLILYGLIKHMARTILVFALALIAFMVLVSEGLIDLPRFIGK